jgi:hypothetical protein
MAVYMTVLARAVVIILIGAMLGFGLLWSVTKPCPDGTVSVLGSDRWFCIAAKEP